MKVLLVKDYTSLGFLGDSVDVANGYARNYLIPKGIAVGLSGSGFVKNKIDQVNKQKAKLKAQAQEAAVKLQGIVINQQLKLGEHGKAFGAITAKDIEAALAAEGITVTRKQITIPEQIKAAGDYVVAVKLHSEVSAEVAVKVEAVAKED